jgi:hypothetical protein
MMTMRSFGLAINNMLLASHQTDILSLMTPNGAAFGTGLLKIVERYSHMVPSPTESDVATREGLGRLPGIFGDYPSRNDIAPSIVFLVIFLIISLAHLYVFIKNKIRGQNFYWSLGLGIYCLLRVIGFVLRLKWADDALAIKVGIASMTFSFVPVLYAKLMNIAFANRVLVWKHPMVKQSCTFNLGMILLYWLVWGIVLMGILGQSLPFVYFMSPGQFSMCKRVTRAAAVLDVLYSVAPFLLVFIALVVPFEASLTSQSNPRKRLPNTIQATWIESANIRYFPIKGTQHLVVNDKSICVIPSKTPPSKGISDRTQDWNYRGPKISMAVMSLTLVSLILLINTCFRTASTFIDRPRGGYNRPLSHWIFSNYVFYIFYGAFEIVVNVLYLVFRFDLRFYVPDRFKERNRKQYRHDEPFQSPSSESETTTKESTEQPIYV